MKIGIDARFWGLEHAGIGRYVMEYINQLTKLDNKNQYLIFVRSKYKDYFSFPKNYEVKVAEISHYSVEEQWLGAEIFKKEKLDLLHVPHFNVPLLYKSPFVVTIHDLLWHEIKGLSVTTQNPLIYLTKYMAYRAVVRNALKNSKIIYVPSQTIQDKLVKEHGINKDKVMITYEAPSEQFFIKSKDPEIRKKYNLEKDYVIYVGSAYPHKNIINLVDAIKLLEAKKEKITLVIVSARSVFLQRLQKELELRKATDLVKFLGFVPDRDLAQLFINSLALIQPSLSEGFGLTGLEAMASGTAVVASQTQIFKEIYAGSALFCDPLSKDDIAEKILSLKNNQKLRSNLIKKSKLLLGKYSWKKLSEQTLDGYKKALGI